MIDIHLSTETSDQELTSYLSNLGTTLTHIQINTGDVININDRYFLYEDEGVTEIESDEFGYYKNIPLAERFERWFGYIKEH